MMKCTALIVTFNRLEKLKKSVRETVKAGFSSIVIVNNGSSDGTREWLSSLSEPAITILNLNDNLGGAGGFKVGSQYICSYSNADWVFFYDDDAYPEINILKHFSLLDTSRYRIFASRVQDTYGRSCRMNLPFIRVPSTAFETIYYVMHPGRFSPVRTQVTDV
ncbi:glycosyltransferase, partial [Salmonella enterica]|nr:glycosyltransferase [Salmonella enterica]